VAFIPEGKKYNSNTFYPQEKHVFLTKLIPEGNIQYLKYIVRDDIITRNGLYMQDTLGWKVINVLGFSNYNFCYRFDSCVT
jgi:hypothetical protein